MDGAVEEDSWYFYPSFNLSREEKLLLDGRLLCDRKLISLHLRRKHETFLLFLR